MCLAIPMQVIEIDGTFSRCHAKGIERRVSLFLLHDQPIKTGDYVMVHVGYAIQKVKEEEALSSWELYDEMLSQQQTPDQKPEQLSLKDDSEHA